MKSAELYLSFLEESDRNRVLGQRNSKRKTPYNLAKKKRMKALLSWAQKEKGFYLLTTPPVVLVMYQTKVCHILTPLATKWHQIWTNHYPDCPVFHCNDFYLPSLHMKEPDFHISIKDNGTLQYNFKFNFIKDIFMITCYI